ncbi:MAG: hypothetical protein ACE5D4_03630 [Thermodesulfobacteriota bacterium]
MLLEELKRLNRIKINVDENVYQCHHLVESRDESVQECESCGKLDKLWFPEEDAVAGLCDACLMEAYGKENIEVLLNLS